MVSLRGFASGSSAMRPIRIVLGWQVIVTAILTLAFAFLWGAHAALSAALGGAVNVVAGCGYAVMVAWGRASSVGEALRAIFRAEAVKILLILVLLPVVLTNYKDIVHAAFFTSFVITVVVFAAAIAVREAKPDQTGDAGDDK
jgi:ATP synthase protein I